MRSHGPREIVSKNNLKQFSLFLPFFQNNLKKFSKFYPKSQTKQHIHFFFSNFLTSKPKNNF